LLGRHPLRLPVVAVLSGLGTGVATVTLAAMLRRAVGRERLGIVVGLGTGLAYGAANLPPVFAADASFQAVLAMLAACAGIVTGRLFELRGPGEKPSGADYTPRGAALWVLVLLALVGLDSMAFYVIQHTPNLKESTWAGNPRLFANAGVHFLAAVLAGAALDRRWVGRTILLAAGLLIAACALIDGRYSLVSTGGLLYAAAVSVYSTVLVFYPARGARPGLAALVFAVAGWGGSAMGIVLAQGRGRVPGWLLAGTGLIIAGALWARRNLPDSIAQTSQPLSDG
jgi:cytochrome c oxidase cbb3-type subunit 2